MPGQRIEKLWIDSRGRMKIDVLGEIEQPSWATEMQMQTHGPEWATIPKWLYRLTMRRDLWFPEFDADNVFVLLCHPFVADHVNAPKIVGSQQKGIGKLRQRLRYAWKKRLGRQPEDTAVVLTTEEPGVTIPYWQLKHKRVLDVDLESLTEEDMLLIRVVAL